MTSPRVYVDTSAYLAILLGEKPGAGVLRRLRGKTLCSSTVLLIECERNLVRLARDGTLTEKQFEVASDRLREDRDLFIFRDFTIELALSGAFPPVRVPRSLDLIHIRTARWFLDNGGIIAFETLDSAQAAAARDMGLPVEATIVNDA